MQVEIRSLILNERILTDIIETTMQIFAIKKKYIQEDPLRSYSLFSANVSLFVSIPILKLKEN